jgi:hypothetical protein
MKQMLHGAFGSRHLNDFITSMFTTVFIFSIGGVKAC